MEITSSIILFKPGMYILRHPKGGLPPLTVGRAPGSAASAGKLEILATPNTKGSILRDGGDCIVMQITEAPVEMLVTAYLERAGAAAPTLRIDQIALDAAAAPAQPGKAIEIAPNGVSIIGHFERTGDVVAAAGQSLGEPTSNLRLEGFQVMWPDRPSGVDLAYGIAVEGIGAVPIVKTGKFCGTKGQARRITEVTFALVGPQAEHFRLEGTAHFSGGFQIPVSSGLALSGPSGLEHLTALSLRALPAPATKSKTSNPWDASPQTKVFKAAKAAPIKASAPKAVALKPPGAKPSPLKVAAQKVASKTVRAKQAK
jgi:hypothetical protein